MVCQPKPIPEWIGLKYPDEFLVRHFFKMGLHSLAGRVLELGCGNGSNLGVYAHHGWEVTGLDIDDAAIEAAKHNIQGGAFHVADLSHPFTHHLSGSYDALLLPSVLYYLPRQACERALKTIKPFLKTGAPVYWRMRLKDDYRYGRGEAIEPDGFRLDIPETGEKGAINVFYDQDTLVTMGQRWLGLSDIVPQKLLFDNVQNGQMIRNSEIILWGRSA